jgi:hypothetical protein
MYANGNFESHLAALCFLGTLGLTVVLVIATAVLYFKKSRWAGYSLAGIVMLLTGYAALVAMFSFASYDRTVARGDEKFFCALDCHIAYSVQHVERMKSMGDTFAHGEFVVVTLRTHFDERTIAPWRGNGALTPDPPTLVLVDASGHQYPVAREAQRLWDMGHQDSHTTVDPLRPGESYETTWVFEVPADAQSVRLFAGWHGFPSYLLIGDEDSPRHGKTYFAL